jgi:hypothetical protein
MKGGVLNDIIDYNIDYVQFKFYISWVYSNAYRIFSQPQSLMNVAR